MQWFYFSVKNGKKRETLKMNLCNLSKGKTLYDSVAFILLRDYSHTYFPREKAKLMDQLGANPVLTWELAKKN